MKTNTWQKLLDQTIPNPDDQKQLQQYMAFVLMRAPEGEKSAAALHKSRS